VLPAFASRVEGAPLLLAAAAAASSSAAAVASVSFAAAAAAAAPAAVAVSAEQLVFQAAQRLAHEGAVSELLGQWQDGRDHYDKARQLVESLLLDGSVERPSSRDCAVGGGGGGGASFVGGGLGGDGGGGGASGASGGGGVGLCDADRLALQHHLDSFARRAEELGRQAGATDGAAATVSAVSSRTKTGGESMMRA
ncbi:unnamed protein product, partial [Phaeothamnion confervicola]